MSLSIRPLGKKALGQCALCTPGKGAFSYRSAIFETARRYRLVQFVGYRLRRWFVVESFSLCVSKFDHYGARSLAGNSGLCEAAESGSTLPTSGREEHCRSATLKSPASNAPEMTTRILSALR